jgi:hypothetical protein
LLLLLTNARGLHAAAPPKTITQLAELTPSTRATADWFGISTAISGRTLVVGDFDSNIESYGAAYVYVEPDDGWHDMTQVAKLTSSDSGEGFGTSVAIYGSIIVVGAANASNLNALASSPGAAYVFVEPAGGWTNMTETAKFTVSAGIRTSGRKISDLGSTGLRPEPATYTRLTVECSEVTVDTA